ncbi:MAG: hypothetical protein ABIF09_05450, partial [Gemmatimonadota bacterium]
MDLHHRDEKLVSEILGFARRSWGDEWFKEASIACLGRTTDADDPHVQIVVPWALYHFDVGGRTPAERYLQERGRRLTSADRDWIDTQRAAWLSVWEVRDVQAGVGMAMRDLLSGTTRFVHEQGASRVLYPRDALLARVADSGDIS